MKASRPRFDLKSNARPKMLSSILVLFCLRNSYSKSNRVEMHTHTHTPTHTHAQEQPICFCAKHRTLEPPHLTRSRTNKGAEAKCISGRIYDFDVMNLLLSVSGFISLSLHCIRGHCSYIFRCILYVLSFNRIIRYTNFSFSQSRANAIRASVARNRQFVFVNWIFSRVENSVAKSLEWHAKWQK